MLDCTGSRCLAVCRYDRRCFGDVVLLDVLRTHPIAIIGAEIYDNGFYITPAGLPAAELGRWVQNRADHKREVSQRDATLEALRESKQRYRNLYEHVPVELYRVTSAEQIIHANPAPVEMLGYPDKEALLSVNAVDLFVRPEYRQRGRALL